VRSRNIVLGCALAGMLGFIALPPAPARAGRLAGATGPAGAISAATAAKAAPALSIGTSATAYGYSSQVRLTVSLGRTYANRRVSVYAAPAGLRPRLWRSGKVSAAGHLRGYFLLTRTTTFTAVFGGDARDAPARASRTLYAAAHVANGLGGYDKKIRARGITYYVFRSSRMLILHSTVAPNKRGECLKPETEQWDTGSGWTDHTSYGCDFLDGHSHDRAPFNLAQAAGDRYRIRAVYVHSAGDRANLSAVGPWLYLMVVR
jgi:hypothetical protein